ncbi:hypothetical protein [Janthinobacterium sp. B9-8]|uniref:hypothetical protein n=1 Tax=Janthinobacterium sp. B9-8 TaxID=1236179 RepID=UPI00061CE834|nr:hypothetical protein [Janthinobacterium sp. B9-8]AMC34306.1 hypothetical protein VN23_06685 [Janthinobacterium sp. B9-8]
MRNFILTATLIGFSVRSFAFGAQEASFHNQSTSLTASRHEDSKSMSKSKNPVQLIAENLKTHKIIRSELNTNSITDEYALMKLIRENTKKSQVKLYDQEIGTDNDADADYIVIMQKFSKVTNGAITYEAITSRTSENNVKINFTYNQKEYSWSFEQESSNISEEFLTLLMNHSKNCETGEFINLMDENSIMIGFLPKETVSLLYQNNIIY